MPHGITQCYLPPGRGDIPALTDGVPNRQTDRQTQRYAERVRDICNDSPQSKHCTNTFHNYAERFTYNLSRQSYNKLYIKIIPPKLRSTYGGRLIYKISYEGREAFLGYDSLARSHDRLR